MTMTFAPEAGFIVAAYAVTAFRHRGADRLGGARIIRAQRRLLGEMEEQGVTRRSRRGQGS